jgi:histone H3/H4
MANAVKYSQIWLDGVMKYQVASASINTSLAATAGTHRLTVQSADVTNIITKQTIYVTVPSTSPSCTPGAADPSVTICAPAANATVKSPVTITAATKDSASAVTNMFIWVDGVKQWTGTGSSVNTSLALATGAHRVTVQAKDAAAHYFQSTVNITVQ